MLGSIRSWAPFTLRKHSVAYAALQEGQSSPFQDDGAGIEKDMAYMPQHRQNDRFWRSLVVGLLVISNVATFYALFKEYTLPERMESELPGYVPESYARIDSLPTKWTRFNWWTEYTEKNFTETDALWDQINPAVGFIQMDREWAKSQHWPDSMHLPSDDSKNVYLLEAYHLLHCVTIIRRSFWEAVHGRDYTFNPPHAGHCIDMLRQYVMCKADNTPLYLFGDDTAGDEQYRKCNNWDSLRDYALEHSACYRDTPLDADPNTFPLGAHFGYCHDTDGLVEGERRGPWKHGAVFDGVVID